MMTLSKKKMMWLTIKGEQVRVDVTSKFISIYDREGKILGRISCEGTRLDGDVKKKLERLFSRKITDLEAEIRRKQKLLETYDVLLIEANVIADAFKEVRESKFIY